ncbi:MAG TPA: 4-(cytidine 5'-diphospho)-2-C-methyl-D-erythritol kinase [Ignavibacteria bacterium]|nr:4-(cytidine 5'-diphospho)-2-C-methyl-D-erythritol kinase [Bacteroidota bacterium]HRE12207.1 4-(cytidine 5'-diphospho)-2-C-methyl-D-erythritol kinase [Ignavibacteria bacterium]HRF65832.1 4-(cytidine 5'-diphospho)-2-C-methyl-D-erythritol kinase [Ignavibacteria bacterium]HRJ03282.1 4-(cytidine 5'-diphospho)-2-C-methyl-D-erythritol kinase [Ignavibacteria bacterium]
MRSNKAKTYRIVAPAKINAGLRILSKRKDGFHNLETIFYPVKLQDKLTVRIKKLSDDPGIHRITVKTDSKENISGKNNICYKAAELFMGHYKAAGTYRIDIAIKKNIPTGAGLGGGSSDAAAVLKILLKHFRFDVYIKEIIRLALIAGSDVPFFMLGKAAYAAGRGEKLTPLPGFKIKGKILIVNPGIHISTPWAFKALGINNSKRKVLDKVRSYSPADNALMINDFERVVFKKYPEIEKIKYDMLALGAEYALMSGSGSTVYGVFKGKEIKNAEKYFQLKKYKVFVS